MKQKLITIGLLLLINGYSYSQNVLIDEETGDTMVAITISQMDGIYIELLQKDSLSGQAIINASKEVKYLQLIDSAKVDLKMSQTALKGLSQDNQKQKVRLKRNRHFLFGAIGIIILQIIL
jgi:hypothetical protein